MSGMIFLSPDEPLAIPGDVFREKACQEWGENVPIIDKAEPYPYDLTVQIKREGETSFQVFHDRTGESVSTDGDPDQYAEVALWVLSLVPEPLGGRLWMTDQGFTGHVDLAHGMTVADVHAGWVSHAEHPPEI